MTTRWWRRFSAAFLAGIAAILVAGGINLASGQLTIVVTEGVSMNPVYYEGDLVVVSKSDAYSVGDIAAFNLDNDYDVALHRIIGGDPSGFVFKGDNNESVDPRKPAAGELVGKAVFHLPQGGLWLNSLTSPPVLGVLAFALVASGRTAATTRHRRNRRKEAAMSRHTSSTERTAPVLAVSSLPPSLRTSAAITAVLAILGGTLGVLAWSGPLEEPSTAEVKSGTHMAFSYTADVGRSPAYDGTKAASPDPIFRKLANTVDVKLAYSGDPGSIIVVAELSTPDGWHSTVPLAPSRSFTEGNYEGSVRLDLKSLEAKAQAASAVTGMPPGNVALALVPQVRTNQGAEFSPKLKLNLTPLQLTLAGGEESLIATDTSTVQQTALAPRTLGVDGWNVTAATARVISSVLLLAALATAAVVIVFARRTAPSDEAAAIRRRYAAQLVRVHPMPAPQGRPVIDVTTFATLAKLAERYGLLVLHWTRSGVETFIVQDESTTYRYRPAASATTTESELLDELQDRDVTLAEPSRGSEA